MIIFMIFMIIFLFIVITTFITNRAFPAASSPGPAEPVYSAGTLDNVDCVIVFFFIVIVILYCVGIFSIAVVILL